MIAKVTPRTATENAKRAETRRKKIYACSRSCVLALRRRTLASRPALQAHDLERTQVLLTFARDGSFVLDVCQRSRAG
jgi:hypothetical protein